jgi:hypothetical protein
MNSNAKINIEKEYIGSVLFIKFNFPNNLEEKDFTDFLAI